MRNEQRTSNVERVALGPAVRALLCCSVVGMSLCASGVPAQSNGNSGISVDSFKVIWQQSIFDPNRPNRKAVSETGVKPQPRIETIHLVGTMSYSKGKFAFFDSTVSQYRKVLERGANIGGYTIKDITANGILLAANDKQFEMKIGTQLRNENQAGWKFSGDAGLAPKIN